MLFQDILQHLDQKPSKACSQDRTDYKWINYYNTGVNAMKQCGCMLVAHTECYIIDCRSVNDKQYVDVMQDISESVIGQRSDLQEQAQHMDQAGRAGMHCGKAAGKKQSACKKLNQQQKLYVIMNTQTFIFNSNID